MLPWMIHPYQFISDLPKGNDIMALHLESRRNNKNSNKIALGFIGTEVMGKPMTLRLLDAGYKVTV